MASSRIKAGTILLTGISASGKTTLGRQLLDDLVQMGVTKVQLLDGEDVRKRLQNQGRNYGHSAADRKAVLMEMASMALKANQSGYICIVCTIAHQQESRRKVREKIGKYMEVYLECEVSVCANRDYKDQYRKAYAGLYDVFIGVTEPYQHSEQVELTLRTDCADIDQCSEILLRESLKFLTA